MAQQGWDFRATSGFVTDPTDCDFNDGTSSGTSSNGFAWAWSGGSGSLSSRDRNSGIDARLAGIVFLPSGAASAATFTVTLPATGNYDISLALGDASNPGTIDVDILDNTTVLTSITGSTNAGEFIDATGVNRTSAATWVSSSAKYAGTFASTSLVIRLNSPASNSNFIAHLFVEPAAGASASDGDLSVTLDDATLSATGENPNAEITGTLTKTLAAATLSAAGALQTGTITTGALKNNTGTVLASTTIDMVAALSLTDLSVIASWTDQDTDTDGILTLVDASLVSGTSYLVVTSNTDGTAAGVRVYEASLS